MSSTAGQVCHLPLRAMASRPESGASLSPTVVPLVEESLEVEKVLVDQGGYRVSKQVGTRTEIVDELLQAQHAEIERRAIGRDLVADELPQARYEGETFVLPVIEEVLVVTRKFRLVEEVRITRMPSTRRELRSVDLRTEEIRVERLGPEPLPSHLPQEIPFNAQTGIKEES